MLKGKTFSDWRSRVYREFKKSLNNDMFNMQTEISVLQKENSELKKRVKELEVNYSFVSQKLQEKVDRS